MPETIRRPCAPRRAKVKGDLAPAPAQEGQGDFADEGKAEIQIADYLI